MNEQLKAAVYARFSSDNQRDESIDAQLRAIEEYTQRNNIDIVATYVDRARSATTDQRPNFQKMIADSATGVFDVIIVHKLDRFARSKYDSAIYKQKLKVNKVRLISVTENIDGTPESIILESVLEAMAEYYSKNLAREVMKGLCENARNAVHTGGIPPLGYDIEDKKLVINNHEAEAVRIIFRMYNDGHSYGEIIKTLNDGGYKTKLGNDFGKNSLFEILRNEKYMGVLTFNKSSEKTAKGTYNRHSYKDDADIIRIDNGCPAIISLEDFRTARERQIYNRRKSNSNRQCQKYLLSGLIFCEECGSPLHGNRRRKDSQITYRCSKRYTLEKCACKELNQSWADAAVIDAIKYNILSERNIPYIMDIAKQYNDNQKGSKEAEIQGYMQELEEITLAKENILNAIENGFDNEHFKERFYALLDRESKINHQMRLLSSTDNFSVSSKGIRLLINKFKKLIREGDIMALRVMLSDFIDKVTVNNKETHIHLKGNWCKDKILTIERVQLNMTHG